MQITRKSRRQLHIQNLIFLVVLLAVMGMIAWLSTKYSHQADWTANQSNSLSDDSIKLLQNIPGALHITAFSREAPIMRKRIRDLIGRYQRNKDDIHLKFVNPDTVEDKATFQEGNNYPKGFRLVLLGGKVALENDTPAERGYGRVIRRGEG